MAIRRSFGRQPTISATSPAYEASRAAATAPMCSEPPDQSRSVRSAGSRSRKRSRNSIAEYCATRVYSEDMDKSSREYGAIYTRISADQNGDRLGVDRQERE